MEINRAAIKYNARTAIKSAAPHNAYLVTFVYLVIYLAINILCQLIIRPYTTQESISRMIAEGIDIPSMLARYGIYIALTLILSVVAYGYTMYCLRVSRYQHAPLGAIFDGFGIFFRIIGLSIVMGLFIFLWSLLFIIPGIIASLRYSQAFYIMLDHPEYSIMQCLRESRRLMTGRKGEYFVLNLSFFGWALLSVIPFVIIWVSPYIEVTLANYYNAISELGLNAQSGDWELPPVGPGSEF